MKKFEELKNIIKSNIYVYTAYNNYSTNVFLDNKNLTRIDFDYYSHFKILFCHIVFYKNKKHKKTLKVIIKLK